MLSNLELAPSPAPVNTQPEGYETLGTVETQQAQAESAEAANECADCRLFVDGLCTHEDAQGNNARAFAFWAQAVKGYCPKWEAAFLALPLRDKALAIEGAKSLADLVP